MDLWQSILLSSITAFLGFLGGHFNHKRTVNRENTKARRERLLQNIKKVEEFIDYNVRLNNLEVLQTELEHDLFPTIARIERLKLQETHLQNKIDLLSENLDSELEENVESELSAKLKELKNSLAEVKQSHSQLEEDFGQYIPKTKLIRTFLDEQYKYIVGFDADAAIKIIDPSGGLDSCLRELVGLYGDSENRKNNVERIKGLRVRINNIFEDQISKLK